MASVNKQISELDKEERELLEFLLSDEGINLSRMLIIPEKRESDIAPLSFSQESMWFLRQTEPSNPFYSKAAAIRLKGELNLKAFIQTLSSIVQRHEVLRTVFPSIDGRPFQVIQPAQSLNLSTVDLGDIFEPEREAELLKLIAEASRIPFDIEREPSLRLILMHISDTDQVLFFSLHHMISDAWSGGILVREMTALYNAFSNDNPSPLPDLPIQYADFAVWQRKKIQGDVLESELAYWMKQLSGSLPILKLPTNRPRLAIHTVNSEEFRFEISSHLTESLRSLSRSEGVTLFMTFLASFKALLYRYTGEKDLLVGTPITNRSQKELEGLIGMFINTLVLRTSLTRDTTFGELLGKVREVALGAYAHQELPYEKIVEELNPTRSLSHTPVCQVWFVFHDESLPRLEMSGLSLIPIEIHNKATRFEMILDLVQTPSGIDGCFEYNTDLFSREMIGRMVGHYKILLEEVTANPNKRLSELNILPAAERNQILNDFNEHKLSYDQHPFIGSWFSRQAEQTPDAIALVFEDEQLSYGELNKRANQLAYQLRKQGVEPDVRVGICVGRGMDMVIALLGVLKAGGAYIPLDPSYPQERLEFMLSDSHSSILVTHQQLARDYSGSHIKVIYLDQPQDDFFSEDEAGIVERVLPENLAYLIYTSGSTGKPKGVMITQRGFRNYLAWAISEYKVSETTDSVIQTSISFDLTITALFSPLLVGGRVNLLADGASVGDLADVLDKGIGYGLLKITPTHLTALNSLLAESEPKQRSRVLIVGGEALRSETIQGWRNLSEDCRIINEYGPTETVVGSCIFELLDRPQGYDSVPIGTPIANTQLYILDAEMQPVPGEIPGDIYIGGDGLARGYFNRPEVTAEVFIPNPFSQEPGTRFYRTGDKGKFLEQGVMAFLGRSDHMVKIRGYRVEMGEIESVLCQHPAVREAVVIDWDQNENDKRLAAYWVGEKDEITVSELKSYVRAELPDYMVPSVFMVLDALPLTPSGKIDRKALPPPDHTRADIQQEYVAPSSQQQKILADIWSEVLGVEQVGIHDNFFKLGGDSILSILIISRAKQAGFHFTPKQMFQYQTIAELAALKANARVVSAEQNTVMGDVILTPIQKWFLEQQQPEPHHFNQSLMLEARQQIESDIFRKVIDFIVKHHDALRLRFEQDDSGWHQFNAASEEDTPCFLIDLSELEYETQITVIEQSATQIQATLCLSEGPLLRATIYELGPETAARVLVIAHHLAIDGVSWRILLEDMQSIYERLSKGDEIGLGAKTTSYKEWAERLSQYAESPELMEESDYWTSLLEASVKPLPLDKAEGENIEASAESITVSLSEEQTQALLQGKSKVFGTQINDVLLAALAEAFYAWTREERVLVDVEGHGREYLFEEIDVSRTIGWFTAIYPILLEVKGATSEDVLKAVSEQLRKVPNGGIGYGLLRYMKKDDNLKPKLNQMAEAEVSFNYLSQIDQMFGEGKGFVVANERHGLDRSPGGKRRYLIEVVGVIAEGRLQVIWNYSRNLHNSGTIERLAEEYIQALSRLIRVPHPSGAKEDVAPDFPLAKLKQSELDRLLEDVEFEV